MNFVKKGICYNKEKVMNLNRKYLSFLVSELLFLKDDTVMHLIPKTECQYNKIFAKLEDMCDDLNLNIRIIRRKLDLLRECDSLYVNEKVEKEFKIEIEENKIKKNKRIFTYPFEKKPQSIKKKCQDLYRSFPLNKISLLEDSDAIIYNLKRLENIYNDYIELYGSLEEALNISIAKSLS